MKFNINMWLRKDRIGADGRAPIYCKVNYKGQISMISTNVRVSPDEWSSKGYGRITSPGKYSELGNTILLETYTKIKSIYRTLEDLDKVVTSKIVLKVYKGERKIHYKLIEIVEEFVQDREDLGYANNTIRSLRNALRHLKNYLEKINNKNLLAEDLSKSFGDDFLKYLKTDQELGHNQAVRIVKQTQAALEFGFKRDYIETNPLKSFMGKIRNEVKPIDFVDDQDMERLKKAEFDDQRHERVRDMFYFQCRTGLSYCDLKAFQSESHVKISQFGPFIQQQRQKSSTYSVIPLLPEAITILEKYEYKLPVISNQKYNKYLKEVAAICDIKMSLTSHIGRKTFATWLFNNEVNAVSVMKALGHSDLKTTLKYYAEILPKKVIEDFRQAFGLM
ncbi:site-specific integrase [Aureibacter tunicatorum]|uniref:Integrase n=1 Tax=Aureibacter tunicatorum TaxID=866807 RepID=A0AAE3XPZ1_9BACT|nr:phage integrase SAM-like domain-containing protein [Aureibacter tunicatorum]MDR6239963.1 integrase [Aureibacter tunicatorum]BDD04436.1 tyrosine recombinase [Aureibacter tunicatorum]